MNAWKWFVDVAPLHDYGPIVKASRLTIMLGDTLWAGLVPRRQTTHWHYEVAENRELFWSQLCDPRWRRLLWCRLWQKRWHHNNFRFRCILAKQQHTRISGHELTLLWRHNGSDSVSNNQPHHCLLNLFSDADQRKYQSSASLAFVRGIHWWPVNSPHKRPVTRKMFPFDDVIMIYTYTKKRWQWQFV